MLTKSEMQTADHKLVSHYMTIYPPVSLNITQVS